MSIYITIVKKNMFCVKYENLISIELILLLWERFLNKKNKLKIGDEQFLF